MRLGLIGEAEDAWERLPDALDLLLVQGASDEVVYLGSQDGLRSALRAWAARHLNPWADEDAFLAAAARAARSEPAGALEPLLAREARFALLRRLRLLPLGVRAVELLGDRLLLLVRDPDQLDEEDVASAHLIVFGLGSAPELRRFGPRSFYSPGRLQGGHVGLLELDERGRPWAVTLRLDGLEVAREPLGRRQSRVVLSS